MELKQIKSNITWIKNTGNKFDPKLHETAVGIMEHANTHGDYSLMNSLYEVLPRSSRREAFKVWVVDHTPLHFDDKKGMFVKSKSNKTEYQFEEANKTPFWEYTKEVAKSLNLDNLLDVGKLLAMAKKQVQKAKEDGREIKGDMVAFQQRCADLEAFKHDHLVAN